MCYRQWVWISCIIYASCTLNDFMVLLNFILSFKIRLHISLLHGTASLYFNAKLVQYTCNEWINKELKEGGKEQMKSNILERECILSTQRSDMGYESHFHKRKITHCILVHSSVSLHGGWWNKRWPEGYMNNFISTQASTFRWARSGVLTVVKIAITLFANTVTTASRITAKSWRKTINVKWQHIDSVHNSDWIFKKTKKNKAHH